jgi:hypothetical protein
VGNPCARHTITLTFPLEQKARKLSSVLGLAWLRWGITAVCCVPAAAFVAEVLIGTPPRRRRPIARAAVSPRTVILVPAHNEQAVIEGTLANLRAELDAHISLLVVADNCEDDTPRIAERAGARVVRRVDPTRRGKGYAIEFGLEELAKDPPEIVVIVDADCRVEPGSIATLAARAQSTERRGLLDQKSRASARSLASRFALPAHGQRHGLPMACDPQGSAHGRVPGGGHVDGARAGAPRQSAAVLP